MFLVVSLQGVPYDFVLIEVCGNFGKKGLILHIKMVLDIDEFRTEKGGNPDKIRENQRKRYCDVSMVDKIVEADEKWRKGELINYKCSICPIFI